LTSFDGASARSPITGALAVDVLGTRATVLAGELLNFLVRNIEIRRERLFS
jgi:hypothetical protein